MLCTPAQLEALSKGRKKLPRSAKQIEHTRKLGKGPRTQKQIATSRELCRKMGLNTTSDTIVGHHNDLCRGEERPDDITYMSHGEHTSLHAKLRVENGTHHWLAKNRKNKE